MRPIPLLIVLTLGLSLYSCGGGGGGGSDPVVTQPEEDTTGGSGGSSGGGSGGSRPARLVYDSELSPVERQALDISTASMGSLAVNGSTVRGFSQVFGGNRSSNVVSYFERRVNYALSGSTDVAGRVVVSSTTPIPPGFYEAELLARNVGAALWLGSVIEAEGTLGFAINDRVIDINSSRVGIMQFGNIFPQRHPVQQVNTLLHEARHSDCTGGLSSEDLASWRAGQPPQNKNCGHIHVVCPPGHPLAGELACDAHPWGAYAVGAIHSLAVTQSCASCSVPDKTVAEQEALDSLSRLLYNPEDLFEGRLGPANMSSSNNVGN